MGPTLANEQSDSQYKIALKSKTTVNEIPVSLKTQKAVSAEPLIILVSANKVESHKISLVYFHRSEARP